ncbi:MAG: GNAT family N-acetyltransferase [Fibrobacter sp.]|nr:GNAT family N-acetyltransferase [Fibrobacter sp.]
MFSSGEVNPVEFKVVRLTSAESVKNFDCGDTDLNDFILNRAVLFDKYLLAASYACVDVNDASRVYAYFSLANDKLAMSDFKDKSEFNRFRKKRGFPNEKRLKSYPAVKLCRLAVDNSVKGKRIGSMIIDIIKYMFVANNKTGCRFLTVDAYLGALSFYEGNGFRQMLLEDNDPHTRVMYFDLIDLAA